MSNPTAETKLTRSAFERWLKKQPEALEGGSCPLRHYLGSDRYTKLYKGNGLPRWARNLVRRVDGGKTFIHWAQEGKSYLTSQVWDALKGCGRGQ